MGAKHQTPEYRRNAPVVRSRVRAAHRAGRPVACWRCRRPIAPGQPFDVGHINGAIGSALHELAPEHRHSNAACIGNRAAGGKQGAHITNSRRHITVPTNQETTKTWPI